MRQAGNSVLPNAPAAAITVLPESHMQAELQCHVLLLWQPAFCVGGNLSLQRSAELAERADLHGLPQITPGGSLEVFLGPWHRLSQPDQV